MKENSHLINIILSNSLLLLKNLFEIKEVTEDITRLTKNWDHK